MPTKPSTTKKAAAKPKRYVRVAVKAGKATLQESDHPGRGFKPQRQPKPTAEDIGRSIGDALGRRLEDLLAKPDKAGFDAVSAWAVEKLGDGVTGYRANCATAAAMSSISPVEEALQRLRGEISAAEVTTDIEMEKLDALLSPVQPVPGGVGSEQQTTGSGPLTGILNDLAERIARDNRRRTNMLGRLEL